MAFGKVGTFSGYPPRKFMLSDVSVKEVDESSDVATTGLKAVSREEN